MNEFNLQYFADEEEYKKKTGADSVDDAGQSERDEKNEVASDKPSFDELIRGEYRDEYGKRVEEIVKKRIKDHSMLKRDLDELKNGLKNIKDELGIESDDPREIVSQLKERVNTKQPSSDIESKNEDFREGTKRNMLKLLYGCEAAKEIYPQFDIREEIKDPDFRRILRLVDNDPKRAFEILHYDDIIAGVINDTARLTEERISGSIASKASRPTEGAQSAASAVYINQNPGSLTKSERADIKKRVRRGERIVW